MEWGKPVVCSLVSGSDGSSGLRSAKEGNRVGGLMEGIVDDRGGASNKGDGGNSALIDGNADEGDGGSDAGDLGWNNNDVFLSESEGEEKDNEAIDNVIMDDCSGVVQSKDKDSRPKDPDTTRAAFRAQAKSAILTRQLRRLANNENVGLHDEIVSVFVGKSARFDPIKYDVDWIVESRINKVAALFDVPPDGECGYDALQAALQDLLPPGGDVPDWLLWTPHRKFKLRQKIRQYFEDNLLLFLDLFDPM